MKPSVRFKSGSLVVDLAYVNKLAKENNGVKYLLVRQDLFDRTVVAKGMEWKEIKGTDCALLAVITKKNQPKRVRV